MKKWSFILVILLFYSCLGVHFVSPPLKGVQELTEFPLEIQGTYALKKDTIQIGRNLISAKYFHLDQRKSREELKFTDMVLEGDSLYFPRTNKSTYAEILNYTITDDSIFYIYRLVTMMHISDSFVVKQMENSYVLSIREGEYWRILIMDLKEESIEFSAMLLNNEDVEDRPSLEDLASITKVEEVIDSGDTISVIDPTKKEFMNMIKGDFFSSATQRMAKLK